jgi:hypothetical protein
MGFETKYYLNRNKLNDIVNGILWRIVYTACPKNAVNFLVA